LDFPLAAPHQTEQRDGLIMKSPARLLLLLVATALLWTRGLAQTNEFASETISIGVVVSNVEKSVEFYTQVVGMKKTGGFSVNADMGKRTGLTDGQPVSITVLKLGESKTATEWKLMSFGKPASHPKQNHLQDDTGMQYITIHVKSLKPVLERIKAHQVKLLGDTPISLGGNSHFVLIQDPDGTFVELIGPLE
jgi:catechol 2,3-dioxygenase-like lactoylglutathione lyase family enzyme